MEVLQQMWLYEIIGGMLLMCQNTTMRVYGAWIKLLMFYVQKHIAALAMCHNPTLVRNKRNWSIDNKSSLVQVMAWCQTGTKPLTEAIMSQFSDSTLAAVKRPRLPSQYHIPLCGNGYIQDTQMCSIETTGYNSSQLMMKLFNFCNILINVKKL